MLYLNLIHAALTNHKHDAQNYNEVTPEYGGRADVKALAQALSRRNMRLVLDGVFNHIGRSTPILIEVQNDPFSPYRDWFYFDAQWAHGYRAWADVANLPELNWENPAVRRFIYAAPLSAARSWLNDGVDGGGQDEAVPDRT